MEKSSIISLLILICVYSISCNSKNSNINLERVLAKAGKNRIELENVLEHYKKSNDTLKYKAAVFLIENMEDKFSYAGQQYDQFVHLLDSVSGNPISVTDYKTALDSFWRKNGTLVGKLNKVFDIDTIKSGFLIRNIDQACYAYKTSAWNKQVNFADFCEYILPYRIGNEPLEDFRDFFYTKYSPLLKDSLTIQKAADSILKQTSLKEMEIMTFPDFVPDLPISTLLKIRGGTCRESSNLGIYILRSMGLPVADDMTPQWPNRGLGHWWSALLINKNSCIDFEGATSQKVGQHLLLSNTHRMAKAYRHTYSKQRTSLAMQNEEEPIPDFFKSPYFKDVSSNYFPTIDINVDINSSINNRFAYICVFNNKDWVPIHWSKIINNNAIFTKMGKQTVYLPAIYDLDNMVPIANPILVDSTGNLSPIIPNKNVLQTLVLKRKYPVFDWWNTRTLAMRGGRFQAANKADFSDCIDVYKINTIPEMTYQSVTVSVKHGYKYWRYLAPDTLYGDIAELQFFSDKNQALTGKIIGTKVRNSKNTPSNVFDDDPLTYFQGDTTNGNWVGLAFDTKQQVNEIKFLCRNDDNFIRDKELYELFYWDNGKWSSLGQKTGDNNQTLVYLNAPTDALFLLHNITKGKEERIFTYKNGKQIWW